MSRSPELMLRALNIHNKVIRNCKWEFVGWTLEQEGDSYLLVFHDPQDAVSFCLMVRVPCAR